MTINELIMNNTKIIQYSCYPIKPKVTVIYNVTSKDEVFIMQSLASIFQQTIDCIELIIIMQNNTKHIINYILEQMDLKDISITLVEVNINNNIPGFIYYLGVINAHSEFIIYSDSHTSWIPTFIEEIRCMMITKNYYAAYGQMSTFMGEDKTSITTEYHYKMHNIQDLISHNHIFKSSFMIRKAIFNKVGLPFPFIEMSNLYFWEFILRVKQFYPILDTNINAGISRPPDSVLSTSEERWHFAEYISYMNNSDLMLENYHNLDIHFPNVQQISSELQYFMVHNITKDLTKKRILILAPMHMFPSVTLYFERIPVSKDYITRCIVHDHYDVEELAMADVLIIVRDLFGVDKWIKAATKLSIPIYYFMDDNFTEINTELALDSTFREFTIQNMKKKLDNFKGVIFSTQSLLEYYSKHHLHNNLSVFEPIMGNYIYERNSINKDITVISYMGGVSRAGSLHKYLLPALKKLSKKYYIRFICPSFTDSDGYLSENLEIFTIPFMESLDQIIMNYSLYNIDIQLHCSIDTKNNTYKTINGLMNSVQVGAAFIVTDSEPYKSIPNKENLFLSAENSIDGWYTVIEQLILNKQKREELLKNSMDYCRTRFNKNKCLSLINTIVSSVENHTNQIFQKRIQLFPNYNKCSKYYNDKIDGSRISKYDNENNFYGYILDEDIAIKQLPQLTASKKLNIMRFPLYNIHNGTCTMSLIAGLHNNRVQGTAVLNIYADKKHTKLLRKAVLSLNHINDNGLIRFEFIPISIKKICTIYCELTLYTQGPQVSIFCIEENIVDKLKRKLMRTKTYSPYYIANININRNNILGGGIETICKNV